jgi:hypothetical protein
MTLAKPKSMPPAHLLNPKLYAEHRRRWPDSVITPQSLFDAAVLGNLQHHVPSSPEVVATLRKELAVQQLTGAPDTSIRRQFKQLGFDDRTIPYRSSQHV